MLKLLADNWLGTAAQISVLPVSAGGTGHRNITVYSTVYINGINCLTNTIYGAHIQYVGRFLGARLTPGIRDRPLADGYVVLGLTTETQTSFPFIRLTCGIEQSSHQASSS